MKSECYEKWKEYFGSAGCSIFKIIENAIMVAAMDDPKTFREKRNEISEKVYSAVKMCESCGNCAVLDNDHFKCEINGECGNCEVGLGFGKTSHYTIQETEELGDQIEQEQENLRHILEIKKQLDHNEKEGETEMVHMLKTLSLIVQSVEDLKSTKIGKTVSNLQHHWSSKVTGAARNTMKIFKKMIKDRASDNAVLSEKSKDTELETNWEEAALPTIPLDGDINMCSIPPLNFSDFFDGMDHLDENDEVKNKIEEPNQRQTRVPKETKAKRKMVEPTNEGLVSMSRNNGREEKQQLDAKSSKAKKNSRPSHNGKENGTAIHEGRRNPPAENKRKVENGLREELEPKRQKPSTSRMKPNEKLAKGANSRPSDTEYSLQRFKAHKMQIDADNAIKTNNEENDRPKANQRANAPLTKQSPKEDVIDLEQKLELSKRKLQQGYQEHEKSKRITKYIPVVGSIPKDNCTSRTSRMWNNLNNRRNK